jgi:hypothetical protein
MMAACTCQKLQTEGPNEGVALQPASLVIVNNADSPTFFGRRKFETYYQRTACGQGFVV